MNIITLGYSSYKPTGLVIMMVADELAPKPAGHQPPPSWLDSECIVIWNNHIACMWRWCYYTNFFNTLRPRQNGRHFADDILKCIFSNQNVWIPIEISLKFVPKGPIDTIPALVQIMTWRRPGDKPLSDPMMVTLPTHICVTRPQWVKSGLEVGTPLVHGCVKTWSCFRRCWPLVGGIHRSLMDSPPARAFEMGLRCSFVLSLKKLLNRKWVCRSRRRLCDVPRMSIGVVFSLR